MRDTHACSKRENPDGRTDGDLHSRIDPRATLLTHLLY
jgi:hypothetical protein